MFIISRVNKDAKVFGYFLYGPSTKSSFVQGPAGSTKKVLIRGIGPSLADHGLTGVLADPLLELHRPDGKRLSDSDLD